MFSTILNALIPVAFVIFLGWFAGYRKIIDNKHSESFATYVMNFSFPCLLFSITATSKLDEIFDSNIILAFTISLMGMYFICLFIYKYLLKKNKKESAQGAFVCSFPDMAFMGIPIFTEILGSKALLSIVIGNMITSILMIPLTIILLESTSNKKLNISQVFLQEFISVVKKPLFFAPILGIIYAYSGLSLPSVFNESLTLIGKSTSGVSLFALGLIMSSFVIKFNKNVLLNISLKNFFHPALMMALVFVFGIKGLIAKELVLLCAMPTATMTTMFALKYNTLIEDSTSSAILGTLISIISLSLFMVLVHI
ncbi:hypothetical protein CF386_11980 [Paraphotobacterium marinum]|uniref:Transporter n=1 Tax=Paraphotobacterium marinum TaxID=1755811 RepID=A0A220VH93_9GAMM|nr:AEC family transporter [Paraphotobacterium marinum]ASK79754.1 hypothetical protein CF386_11980 [Paraphotobacterium marinum]